MKERYHILQLTDGQQLITRTGPGIEIAAVSTDSAQVERKEELEASAKEIEQLQKRIAKKPVDFDTLKLKPKRKAG